MEGLFEQPKGGEKEGPPAITLWPLGLTDVDDFMAWASDDRVSHFCTWVTFTDKEAAIDYIKATPDCHPWFRAICFGDRPIGSISVRPGSGVHRCRPSIGYGLAYKYWCRGIAAEAIKMAVVAAFAEWPELERVEGLVGAKHVGSQRELEKAWFVREGCVEEVHAV